jgi:Ca2+/Na+ antiporter
VLETLQGLFGFALIIGLFVWYVRERRAKNRPPALAPERVDVTPVAAEAEPVVRVSSPNWGAPIVYVLLLYAALKAQGTWWSMLWLTIYFAIFGVAWYSTFSEKELEDEQARRPGTTRREHYLKLGVPYLLFPMLGWLGVFVFGWKLAVFIPAIPWLALLAAAAFLTVRGAVSKKNESARGDRPQ